jgi:anhydro-N-acetylmuramic acid kinase
MNKYLEKLAAIAGKDTRRIIGLMSGTSLDGLDVALCAIEGSGFSTKLQLEKFITVPYNDDFKNKVRSVFSKKQADLSLLCLLNEWIAEQHAGIINECLAKWKLDKNDVDLVASHGQTIYHAPKHLHQLEAYGNGTLQIGDGDHLAVRTGIITISDFRQKHLAAGGEGAPLAAYGDYLLFGDAEKDTVLLNIGGIANFSFLPAGKGHNFYSTDIGPGNTLMDAWMQLHFKKSFDENASIARQGTVNEKLLAALMDHGFLRLPFPKTTGPELFNLAYVDSAMQVSGTNSMAAEDIMATLNRFTAQTICDAMEQVITPGNDTSMYVSGGGMHNGLLMDFLHNTLPVQVYSTAEKQVDPDAKEAILFAILANECVAGNIETFGNGAANFPAVSMGKISLPA